MYRKLILLNLNLFLKYKQVNEIFYIHLDNTNLVPSNVVSIILEYNEVNKQVYI